MERERATFCVLKCDSWFLFTSNCISLENWELTQGNQLIWPLAVTCLVLGSWSSSCVFKD